TPGAWVVSVGGRVALHCQRCLAAGVFPSHRVSGRNAIHESAPAPVPLPLPFTLRRSLFPLSRPRLPHVYPPLRVPAGRGELPAVGAEGHAPDHAPVKARRQGFPKSRPVPDPDGLVLSRRSQVAAVRAEGYIEDAVGVTF